MLSHWGKKEFLLNQRIYNQNVLAKDSENGIIREKLSHSDFSLMLLRQAILLTVLIHQDSYETRL